MNKYWKRSYKNFKKLKDTPKNADAKKLNHEIKKYFQEILVLLENNFSLAASQIIHLLNDEGKFRKSNKDPTNNNFYKSNLKKMKDSINDVIKWDTAFVAKIKELEKMAKELEK